jgi:threonine dehydrogenase-like Zn-dependent dehydrogenase
MRATLLYGAGDVRVEDVPDSVLKKPTDALVRITASCICGSDLWPYASHSPEDGPARMGHEFIGIVEDTGSEVTTVRRGDLVVAPFAISDNTCEFCREGLHTSCSHPEANFWDGVPDEGAQAEAIRVPLADGTLVKLPVAADSALIPSLLTLSDVLGTGHHAAVAAGVGPGSVVAVVGDGAVGLCAVLASARLGAEQIIILGRHPDRTDLARRFGATDVVAARGEEAVAAVRELTGHGAPSVLECVGTQASWATAVEAVRPGGRIGYVGVPTGVTEGLALRPLFGRNTTVAGGIAPTRAYLPELLADVLGGALTGDRDPGAVFDLEVRLDDVAEGYRAMHERTAIKALVRP